LKLTITISGQDEARLAERIDQLVRERAARAAPETEIDPASSEAPTPARHRPPRDRRR